MTDNSRNLHLGSFAEVLAHLARQELQATVIGGCAVGAYARVAGVVTLSADLDLLVSDADQRKLEASVRGLIGVLVTGRPAPRGLQTLVIDWRGLEINALTGSSAPMPEASLAFRDAWLFGGVRVLQPFALLRNKLGLRRPKDEEQIAILNSFLIGHVVYEFSRPESSSRARLRAPEQYMEAIDSRTIPRALFDRLVVAADEVGRRFLFRHAPDEEARDLVLDVAAPGELDALRRVAPRLWFGP